MEIIENNHKPESNPQKIHTCRWCKSKIEYEKSDITTGDLYLSQQEQYLNIVGLICPACSRFDNIKNGY